MFNPAKQPDTILGVVCHVGQVADGVAVAVKSACKAGVYITNDVILGAGIDRHINIGCEFKVFIPKIRIGSDCI